MIIPPHPFTGETRPALGRFLNMDVQTVAQSWIHWSEQKLPSTGHIPKIIMENPLQKRLVKRPEDGLWSSYNNLALDEAGGSGVPRPG
jgi:hypothetical protein